MHSGISLLPFFVNFFFCSTVEVPFPSARLAEIAYHVLRVDGEPKRSGVSKELIVKNNILEAYVVKYLLNHTLSYS